MAVNDPLMHMYRARSVNSYVRAWMELGFLLGGNDNLLFLLQYSCTTNMQNIDDVAH